MRIGPDNSSYWNIRNEVELAESNFEYEAMHSVA